MIKKTYSYSEDKILVTKGSNDIQHSMIRSLEWYHAKLWIHNGEVLKNHGKPNPPVKTILKNYIKFLN